VAVDGAIVLSVEMTDQGYWLVTWSLRAGLRLPIVACRVGISRSEAIADTTPVAAGYLLRSEVP